MDRKAFQRFLIGFALCLYTAAVFLPWLSEKYSFLVIMQSSPMIYPPPPVPTEGLFWSFQTVVYTHGGYGTLQLSFFDFWLADSKLYSTWLWVLVFQGLTIILGFVSFFKEKTKRKSIQIATAAISFIAPILCIYQRSKQMERIWIYATNFSIGFWLATVSAVLFSISVLFSSWTKRKASES